MIVKPDPEGQELGATALDRDCWKNLMEAEVKS